MVFPLYNLRGQGLEFQNYVTFNPLKIVLTSAKRVDPDKMQLYAAFHLGLRFLQKYPFMAFLAFKGLKGVHTVNGYLFIELF